MKFLPILALLSLLFFASCKENIEVVAASDNDLTDIQVNSALPAYVCPIPPPPDPNAPPPPTSIFIAVPSTVVVVEPTVSGTVATFTKSGYIGNMTGTSTNKRWNPTYTVGANSPWTEIKIAANVTLYGNIKIDKTDFKVTGANRETSIIDGSKTPYNKGDKYRFLTSIRHTGRGTITIKSIQSRNPANFHLTGFSLATIDDVKILENRGTNSTDAFHFARGATVNNSSVNTYDDVLYIGETTKISNSTIYHNKHGAIFMASWGQKISEIGKGTTEAINCTFIDNFYPVNADDKYAHGIVGWSQKCDTEAQTAKVKFTNCSFIGNPNKVNNKLPARSAFVSFGKNHMNPGDPNTESSKVYNSTIELIDAKCSWNSVYRGVGVSAANTKVKMTTCKP